MFRHSKKPAQQCSFCGKSRAELQRLVAHGEASICGGCALLAVFSILADAEPTEESLKLLAKEFEPFGGKVDYRPYPERYADMLRVVLTTTKGRSHSK